MFEQHPVPQQISSYQFRLVGDMTLKQFFQLAAGAVLGLIVYSLPLPGFLKWPVIALLVIGGAAFAFLPIQDRPLEQWLVAFFRSIYRPTLFVWRKQASATKYFADVNQAPTSATPAVDETALAGVYDPATRNLDKQEEDFLTRMGQMFKHSKAVVPAASPPPPTPAPQPEPEPKPEPKVAPPEAPAPEKKEVVVPKLEPVRVEPKGVQEVPQEALRPAQSTEVYSTLTPAGSPAGHAAQFSPEAAPPSPPTQPNVIVGQVMDVNSKIVDGAILEISDKEGRPVRALKSNRAGHFLIVTPLPNGEYTITIEKEGLAFDPITIKLAGEVLKPIAVKSKDALPPPPEPTRGKWSV